MTSYRIELTVTAGGRHGIQHGFELWAGDDLVYSDLGYESELHADVAAGAVIRYLHAQEAYAAEQAAEGCYRAGYDYACGQFD